MNETYIKLYRKFLDWGWYEDVNVKVIFIHLLLRASATGKKYKGVEVPVGSLVTTYQDLADDVRLSISKVRTAIDKLVSTNEIALKKTNKYTLITINKWSDYQGSATNDSTVNSTQDSKQIANKSQTNRKQIALIKESKESKESKYIKEKFKKEKSQLDLAMEDFEEMRKSLKKPLTEKAKHLVLKKLQDLAPDDEDTKVAILNQSIEHSWLSVYTLGSYKNQSKGGRVEPSISYDDSNNPEFTDEDMKKLLERRKRMNDVSPTV